MKAVIQGAYGGPESYTLGDVPSPEPRAGEVRVRVRAASLHPDIWHVMTGQPHLLRIMGSGLTRPKVVIPGTDLAGVVDAVGSQATRFRLGERVFGEASVGHPWKNAGTFAEYVCVRETALAAVPEGASFEEAAALPTAGFIALQVVQGEGKVCPGQRVLINGAGGGVGTLALQLARAHGADVVAVDSPEKHSLLRDLGAIHCIDYRQENYTTLGEQYDVIIDVPGNYPFSSNRRALCPGGIYVLVGHDGFGATRGKWLGTVPYAISLLLRSIWNSQLPGLRGAMPAPDRLETLRALLETGQVRPHIGRTFRLEDVREAMAALMQSTTVGRIVLTM